MTNVKVVKVDSDCIEFENGVKLYSSHEQSCCEHHFLNLNDLELDDFEGFEFNLSTDGFFNRIDGYGIELLPINGYPVRIAGHGYNSGYYSSELTLHLEGDGFSRTFDISDCQVIEG